MSRKNSPETAISDAELALMQVLWCESPLSAREITERLAAEKDWHRKTVNTLLSRLEKKGAVSAEKVGSANCFLPLVDEERYKRSATSRFVDRLFGGDIAPLVAHFAEQRPLDSRQLEALQDLLKDLSDDD